MSSSNSSRKASRAAASSPVLAGLAAALAALVWVGCSEDADATRSAAERELDSDEVQVGPDKGRFRPAHTPNSEQQADIDALNQIGYAQGSEPAPERTSVTVHVKERALAGKNLYTSGHAPVAILMDMDGRELHRWSADVRDLWPASELPRNLALVQFWRRAFLRENGDLLAIFEGHGLVKLDRDSKVLWKNRCRAHHDLEVLDNGDILVLTRVAHVVPEIDEKKPVLEDFVTRLDANGNEKEHISLLEALVLSRFTELADRARDRRADILHTNSLVLLDGRIADEIPAFRAGNLLVSSRPLSFISVVDPEKVEVVWTMQGEFKEQHDPQVLENGNLLVFDNAGRGQASSVLELDPVTGATVWEYRGTPAAPFYSATCGTAQRLANGNTLITESDSGRAFEVTREGEIVWEFWNPERVTVEGQEYIATLFEVVRLPAGHPLDWLKER